MTFLFFKQLFISPHTVPINAWNIENRWSYSGKSFQNIFIYINQTLGSVLNLKKEQHDFFPKIYIFKIYLFDIKRFVLSFQIRTARLIVITF